MRTALVVSDGRLAAELRSRLEEEGLEVVVVLESLAGPEQIAADLADWKVSVAFLEVAGLCSGVEKIRALRAAAADLRLVACARDLPGGDVVELLRAGAADCYHSGMSAEDVAELVGRLRRESHIRAAAEPEDCAGHVLGFLSLKPGSGATTLAVQAAFALRRQTGKPVLLIDLNLDAGTLGLTGEIPADHLDVVSAIEALPDLEAGEAWIHRTISRNGIRILPAPFAPFGDSPGMLGAGIRSLIALARRHFEWVILDMAPAAEAGTMTLAATLDQVVVVATPELPCLHLARRRVDELVRAGCQRAALRLALNRTSSKDLIPKDSMESVLSLRVQWALPNNYLALCAAGNMSVTAECPLASAIRRMAKDLAGPAQRQAPARRESVLLGAPEMAAAQAN